MTVIHLSMRPVRGLASEVSAATCRQQASPLAGFTATVLRRLGARTLLRTDARECLSGRLLSTRLWFITQRDTGTCRAPLRRRRGSPSGLSTATNHRPTAGLPLSLQHAAGQFSQPTHTTWHAAGANDVKILSTSDSSQFPRFTRPRDRCVRALLLRGWYLGSGSGAAASS
jgi:hypothetical protein